MVKHDSSSPDGSLQEEPAQSDAPAGRSTSRLEIRRLRVLRGPNQWARFPVIEATVDLADLEEFPSNTLPGFNEAVMAWLPTMVEHRCSVGERGGFFRRMRDGTWMGHVLEHVTIELQSLAGSTVGYGRARETPERGVYWVVVEYREERFALECLATARRLLLAAIAGEDFDVRGAVAGLRAVLLECQLGPSTRSIVEAAAARGIPATRLTEGSLVRLGQGARQRRILASETDRTQAIGEFIAQDKDLSRKLLAEAGIPVAMGRPVADLADALAAFEEIGGPVVVKPQFGSQGRGVSCNLRTREEVESAWLAAVAVESTVVVERFVPGGDYRLLVVGSRLVAASRRHPPIVVGDGRASVRELVDRENADPRRTDSHATALSPIPVDEVTLAVLEEQGLRLTSIPSEGQEVRLRRNANLSTGGTAEDVTDLVHPEVAARAVEAARIVGLDVAGIDIVAEDLGRALESQGAAVIEVNAAPGLRMHLEPSSGRPRDVGGAIVSTLFAPGDDGRIPIAAVTGTNGKTTVTRLIAHCAGLAGGCVGMACSEGVWVGGRMIDSGDCSGPRSARRVLAHPLVTTAVFEAARGGIIREGCGFDACDVAVVTNIAGGDHLGIDGIDTPERLAWVKGAIPAAVRPTGAAVLNAADPLVVDMRRWCKGQVVYFALDSENPVLKGHLAEGGLAATVRDGWIVLCDGPRETRLAHLERVPLTHGGLVSFQVENVLAAAAAAWRLGVPLELVRLGLEGFSAGVDGSPARFNVVEIGGAAVVVDYGHNVPSLARICETLARLPHASRTAVYSAAGDRRDDDLIAQGRLLAASFDRVILYEDACVRGRRPGEIAGLIAEGVRQGTPPGRSVEVRLGGGWCDSAALALDTAGSGHLVLLQPDTVEQTVEWMQRRYGDRVRSIGLQELFAPPVGGPAGSTGEECVEIRSNAGGATLHAARMIESGELVMRAGGRRSAERTRLTMQVERDVHVVPDGAMLHVRHACEPNCGVIIRAGSTEIEMRSLRRIEAGEELTLDYATFEWEVSDGGGPCHCGSPACRGRIGGYRHLPTDVIARYGDFIAEYLRAADPDRAVPTGA